MSTLLLGNNAPVDNFKDDDGAVKRVIRSDLLNQVCTVQFPDDWSLVERLGAVINIWPWESDTDGPEWVESPDGDHLLEVAVSEHFTTADHTCVVGRPSNWNEGRG